MAGKVNQPRKITIKEIVGDKTVIKERVVAAKGKPIKLFNVVGIASGAKPGSTQMGDYLKLVGDFEATNLETGEVSQSGACILPNFVTDGIGAALMRPNAESVEFALTIGAKPDEKSVTGYQYTCESLLPPSEHTPLVALKAKLGGLLAAPKK